MENCDSCPYRENKIKQGQSDIQHVGDNPPAFNPQRDLPSDNIFSGDSDEGFFMSFLRFMSPLAD